MDNKQIIGKRLRALRINQDISQENMAFQLGISQSAYSRMESGKVSPDMERMQKASEIFGLSLEKLVAYCYGNGPLHEILKELTHITECPVQVIQTDPKIIPIHTNPTLALDRYSFVHNSRKTSQ